MGWWRRCARALAELPLGVRVVLVAAAVLHGAGLSWGMPASDGWDVDGVAPRDVLPGLAETFTPGHFYTYPPLHLAILATLTLPVTIAAVARAGSLSVPAVLQVILDPVYMTGIAMVARAVAVLMSLGVVASVASIARELAPAPRKDAAATWAAAFAAAGGSFTYYSHVTNLDVPYLFWAFLGVLLFVRAIARGRPRLLRGAAVCAALGIATKDQAYAMFLVSAPLVVVAWLAADREARKAIAREALVAAGLAAAIVLVVDGAVTNPSGFRARIGFLSGSASQDYATYSRDAAGRWLALLDTARALKVHYPPLPASIVVVIGIATAIVTARRAGRRAAIAAAFPLAVAASFTLAFNMVARRVEERFTLPQALAFAVYGGLGLERVAAAFGQRWAAARWTGRVAAAAIVALAAWGAVRIDAMFFEDPRYDAEAWLREHAGADDGIEEHGLNVYLLRFWPGAHVTRVDPSPATRRNPMPGVTEVQAPLAHVVDRGPRFVVVNECYAWRYLERDLGGNEGRIVPRTQQEDAENADATALFQGLFHHRFPYSLAHESRVTSTLFPRIHMHASLGCPVFVFEREAVPDN
jgi:hypothetical protein